MDGKYCIKHTKMNKMTHFAYNLGIWLGLLSDRLWVRFPPGTPTYHPFSRVVLLTLGAHLTCG